MASWGYDEHNGPATWPQQFPQCGGTKQSPVDIATGSAHRDEELLQRPLSWRYEPSTPSTLMNTGHGWKVQMLSGQGSRLTGGPLQHNYEIEQFHCHWGPSSEVGSEHTVDGRTYAGELHLVHWNVDLFKNFSSAAQGNQGLAVLGIFLQVGNEHRELAKVTDAMDKIRYKDAKCTLGQEVDPAALLPESPSYWTYEGSLTTPPCNESVTWIVFKQPIQVSEEQIRKMRELSSCMGDDEEANNEVDGCHRIVQNFRPPQPLNGRVIREADF